MTIAELPALRRDLKEWMARTKRNDVDLASLSNVDPKTVKRFLDEGRNVRPVVAAAFRRAMRENPHAKDGPPEAA